MYVIVLSQNYDRCGVKSKTKKQYQKIHKNFLNSLWIFVFLVVSFFTTFFGFPNTVETFTFPPTTIDPPSLITYQGKLIDNGEAVTTTQAMRFVMYDASIGGNVIYTASGTNGSPLTINVTPHQGIFSVVFGGSGTNALPDTLVTDNTQIYLEVRIGATTLSPRKQLTSVAYALNSKYLLGLTPAFTSSSAYIPYSDADGNFLFTGNPSGTGIDDGVVYINPSNANANETIFGIAASSTPLFRVDADGDVEIGGDLTVAGDISSVTNLTMGGTFTQTGTSTLATTTISNLTITGSVTGINLNDLAGTSTLAYLANTQTFTGLNTFNATTTFDGTTVFNGNVLGISVNDLSDTSTIAFLPNDQTFTGENTFSATTSLATTTVNGNFTVNTDTLYIDGNTNNVGINTTTPSRSLVVDGGTYFTASSTFLNGGAEITSSGPFDVFRIGSLDPTKNSGAIFIYGNESNFGPLLSATLDTTASSSRPLFRVLPKVGSGHIDLEMGTVGYYGGIFLYNESEENIIALAATSSEDSFILSNFLVGSQTETIVTSSFIMDGDDMYVHDLLGVGNTLYVNNEIIVGTSTLRLGGAAQGGHVTMTGGPLVIDSEGNLALNTTNNSDIITGSGNVGINTSTPGSQLTVDGDTFFTATSTFLNGESILASNGGFADFTLGTFSGDSGRILIQGNGTNRPRFTMYQDSNSADFFSVFTNNDGEAEMKLGTDAYSGLFRMYNAANINTIRLSAASSTDNYIINNFLVGATTESITTSTFVMDGDDMYVADMLGVGGDLFVEDGLDVGGNATLRGSTEFQGGLDINGAHQISLLDTLSDHTAFAGIPYYNTSLMQGDYIYLVGTTNNYLSIVDTSNPSNLETIGQYDEAALPGLNEPYTIAVSGNHAYVLSTGVVPQRLIALDISNPAEVSIIDYLEEGVSGLDIPNGNGSIKVEGNYLYIVSADSGKVEVVDVSDPRNMIPVSTNYTGDGNTCSVPYGFEIQGNYMYLACTGNNKVQIVDISNPYNLNFVSEIIGTGGVSLDQPVSLDVRGRYIYVASYNSASIDVIDASDVANPVFAGQVSSTILLANPTDIIVSGDYAYTISDTLNNLAIINISNPTAPYIENTVTSSQIGGGLNGPGLLLMRGNNLFVGTSGFPASIDSVKLAGAQISTGKIGTAQIDKLNVLGASSFYNRLSVFGGLDVQNGGIKLTGDFGMFGVATSSLRFNTTTVFTNYVSSTIGTRAFIFDSANFVSSSGNYLLSVRRAGTSVFSVESNGDVRATGELFAESATVGTPGTPGDLAERVDVRPDETVSFGDVLIVDQDATDRYRKSRYAYEKAVAGVVSTNPTIVVGNGKTEHTTRMAMVGRVPINVTTENGPIEHGDLLVTASLPGYAMKYDPALDPGDRTIGIIGLALESYTGEGGNGQIMGLVKAGWFNTQNRSIVEMQQDIASLAQASGVEITNNPAELTVQQTQTGSIASVQGNVNLNGYYLVNTAGIIGSGNKWEVDINGRFVTRVQTSAGTKSLYALQSEKTEYVLSGSSELIQGERYIMFDKQTRDIIDPTEPIKVNVTLTSDAGGIFVTQKDQKGFLVKELNNGKSNASFDWVAIVTRKIDGQPVPVDTSSDTMVEDVIDVPTESTNTPTINTSSTNSTPTVSSSTASSLPSTPSVSETSTPPVQETPASQTDIEAVLPETPVETWETTVSSTTL